MTFSKESGFSLIELLVVVVIIGVLGAVGLVGYQAYISQARDATTKDNFEFLKRTLDNDIVSVENDLAARSKFAETLDSSSKCFVLRDRYITQINAERDNPFNPSRGQICDGNHYASYANGGGTPDNKSVSIKRGRTMVYCDGVDFINASYKEVSGKLGMKFCTCTGQDECATTFRFKGSVTTDTTGTGTFQVPITWNTADHATFPSPRVKKLLIGNIVYNITAGASAPPMNIAVKDVVGTVTFAQNTAVYEINDDICFTPYGASSGLTATTTGYLAEDTSGNGLYSTLAHGSTAMPERHRCY